MGVLGSALQPSLFGDTRLSATPLSPCTHLSDEGAEVDGRHADVILGLHDLEPRLLGLVLPWGSGGGGFGVPRREALEQLQVPQQRATEVRAYSRQTRGEVRGGYRRWLWCGSSWFVSEGLRHVCFLKLSSEAVYVPW